jgi:hypothetical protein
MYIKHTQAGRIAKLVKRWTHRPKALGSNFASTTKGTQLALLIVSPCEMIKIPVDHFLII